MVTRHDQRGVALIFVLWLLVLLGVIIAEVASRARAEAALLTSLRSRTVARYAAESGILAATVAIERLLDSSYNPLERASVFRQLDARLASLNDVEPGGAARRRGGGARHRGASRGRRGLRAPRPRAPAVDARRGRRGPAGVDGSQPPDARQSRVAGRASPDPRDSGGLCDRGAAAGAAVELGAGPVAWS